MWYQVSRVESFNIQIQGNNRPPTTNWNNVQNSMLNFVAHKNSNHIPGYNQKLNIMKKIQSFDISSDEDSFNSVNTNNILTSTPVIPTLKDGSFRRPDLPSRISVIRSPLRPNRNLANIPSETYSNRKRSIVS